MEQKEIEEGNKLIAEFMGLKKPVFNPISNSFLVYLPDYSFNNNGGLIGYVPVKWHISWDWLMPVLRKIYDLDIESFEIQTIDSCRLYSSIDNVFKAAIAFIKWYNLNNKP